MCKIRNAFPIFCANVHCYIAKFFIIRKLKCYNLATLTSAVVFGGRATWNTSQVHTLNYQINFDNCTHFFFALEVKMKSTKENLCD